MLTSCKAEHESVSAVATVPVVSACGESGALRTALFGGIEANIQWGASDMECDSMPRPDGAGVRMRFAGEVSGEILAIIIAIPGLKPDEIGLEIPSNVTATVEGTGRFFSTPNLDSCWTEITSQARLAGQEDARAIAGTLYCVAPLGEINGDAAITIPTLEFSTIANWRSK
ncbi:MAG: hypothetical protein OEW73_04020 [Gammaproteobacteria bacterium]|nr:hypothetical protein [Gammaproteobacteria bacterium]